MKDPVKSSQKKLLKTKLKESRKTLELALESANMGTWKFVIDTGMDTRGANLNKILGLEAIESTQHVDDFVSYVHPEDRERVGKSIESAIKNDNPYSEVFRLLLRDGSVKWVHDRGRVYRDDKGNPIYMTGALMDITDAKKSELQIKEANEKYETTFKNASIGIAHVSRTGQWIDANEKLCSILGYSKEELLKTTFQDITHPDDLNSDLKLLQQVLDNKIPGYTINKRYIRKDGSIVWAELSVSTVGNINTDDFYFISLVNDITQKKVLEEKLQEINSRLILALDSASAGTWEWRFSDDYTHWDKKMLKLWGMQPKDFGNDYDSWKRTVHPDDLPKAFESIQQALKGESEYNVIYRISRHSDGETRYIKAQSVTIRDSQSNPIKMVGICFDVTDFELAKQSLLDEKKKYQIIFESTPVSIWEEDWSEVIARINELKKNGIEDLHSYFRTYDTWLLKTLESVKILDVNPETVTMFGAKSKDELLASLSKVFATEDTAPGFIAELDALALGKTKFSTEMKLNTLDGRTIDTLLQMTFPDTNYGDGKIFVSIMDITELKQFQKTLAKYIETLEETKNKLVTSNQELEQFAYIASHDLQEPLRMVSSFLQLIESRYAEKLGDSGKEFINFAVDGANRMKKLIDDLLMFSRVSTRKKPFKEIDLNETIKAVLFNLKNLIEETGAKLTYDKLPVIYADESQMLQLFQNLINNAIKFRGENPPIVSLKLSEDEDNYIVSVADNGIGIDNKHFDRVFDIFQRLNTREKYSGSGIGLSVCKRIAERHGGKISISSEPGKGSQFSVNFPKEQKNNL